MQVQPKAYEQNLPHDASGAPDGTPEAGTPNITSGSAPVTAGVPAQPRADVPQNAEAQPVSGRLKKRLTRYRDRLKAERRGVPARELSPHAPYYTAIAQETGIHKTTLSCADIAAIIKEIGDELGYDVVRLTRENDEITVAELELIGLKAWAQKVAAEGGAKLRRASVMAALVATASTKDAKKIDASTALKSAIDKAKAQNEQELLALLQRVELELKSALDDEHRPRDQRARIRVLMGRQGYTAASLARATNCEDERRLQRILRGTSRFTPSDKPFLEKCEDVLGQPRGSLSIGVYGRRGAGANAKGYPPSFSHLTSAEKAKIAPYLPTGFANMTIAQKEAHIRLALKMIAEKVTPENAARAALQADAYTLRGKLPEPLASEVRSMKLHYTRVTVPVGKRNKKKQWSKNTAKMRISWIRQIMGFLANARDDELRIPKEELSLVLLLDPKVVEAYFQFRARRFWLAMREQNHEAAGVSFDEDDDDNFEMRELVTSEFVAVHEFIATLFDPVNGWMAQDADHRPHRLRKIASNSTERDPDANPDSEETAWLLSPKTIAKAKKNWHEACATAHHAYKQCVANHRKRVEISRDSHESIKAILNDKDPLRAFRMLINGVKGELAEIAPDTMAWAEVLRDLVAIELEAQLGFRQGTFLALTYLANNKGHLQFEDGFWWVRVPRELFKNSDGPFFQVEGERKGKPAFRDFEMKLVDENGLYEHLNLYITIARPRILRGERCDALFVATKRHRKNSKTKVDYALKRGAHDQLCRRLFVKHLMYNELRGTGFPGIFCTAGWHSLRHILATGILKLTGSRQLAADAIQDSEDMVRLCYGQYASRDRAPMLFETRRQYLSGSYNEPEHHRGEGQSNNVVHWRVEDQ